MAYAIVCDGCGVLITQASVDELPEIGASDIWAIELPGSAVKVHLCNEDCLLRWVGKQRQKKVGSGEKNGTEDT